MIGRPTMDPSNIQLDRKEAFNIINLTFEEQVSSLKSETAGILDL
jgi:hypothetical protein